MAIIRYCNSSAFFAILLQLISYANQCLIVFSILPIALFPGARWLLLAFNIMAGVSFWRANQVYEGKGDEYCKECRRKVGGRDHHCAFIGQCVDKANFRFYLSYCSVRQKNIPKLQIRT